MCVDKISHPTIPPRHTTTHLYIPTTPKSTPPPHTTPTEEERRINAQKDMQFFERVRARLRNQEAYEDLLKCINLFAQDIVSKPELFQLVHDVLGRYNDLMLQFREFVERCEQSEYDGYGGGRYQQQHRSRVGLCLGDGVCVGVCVMVVCGGGGLLCCPFHPPSHIP